MIAYPHLPGPRNTCATAEMGVAARGPWLTLRQREEQGNVMLENKVAVIYGAGGGIGGAVARAFAGEGAKVFLTGRNCAAVEGVASDIGSAGGSAEAAQVDALDEQAIDEHLESV